jgi:5-methylcytosine-specific restriction endonuclease McrA
MGNPLKSVEWKNARKICFRDKGTTCYWCGHPGATDVDHIMPKSQGGALFDQNNLAPIHGVHGCATCGRKCNREKSTRTLHQVQGLNASRDWYA